MKWCPGPLFSLSLRFVFSGIFFPLCPEEHANADVQQQRRREKRNARRI